MAVLEAALAAIAVAAIASTGYSVYSGEKSRSAQNEAMDKNEQAMLRQEQRQKEADKIAEENLNRAYSKNPDVNAILSKASQAGRAGSSGTMLTGSSGVDSSLLSLGKKTLLGG